MSETHPNRRPIPGCSHPCGSLAAAALLFCLIGPAGGAIKPSSGPPAHLSRDAAAAPSHPAAPGASAAAPPPSMASPAAHAAQTSAAADPAEIIKAALDAYNRHDLEEFLSLHDPSMATVAPVAQAPIRGLETLRETLPQEWKAFPDARFHPKRVIAGDGDAVAVETVWTGTYSRTLPLLPPAHGQRIRLGQMGMYTVRNGRITSLHSYYDPEDLARQLKGTESASGRTEALPQSRRRTPAFRVRSAVSISYRQRLPYRPRRGGRRRMRVARYRVYRGRPGARWNVKPAYRRPAARFGRYPYRRGPAPVKPTAATAGKPAIPLKPRPNR